MFTGQNILPGFPEELKRVVSFLNERVGQGEFVFSNDPEYWEDHEDIIDTLGLSHLDDSYYFAVSLAYLANQCDGNLVFPKNVNIWRWGWALHLITGVSNWGPYYLERIIRSFEGKHEGIESIMSWATQVYGAGYYDNAVELISLMPQYRISILSGLMENDIDRYYSDYPPADNTEEFALAFVKANLLKTEKVNKAFDMALTFKSFTSTAAMGFFLSIRGKLDEERKRRCEDVVISMLNGNTTPYVTPLCNWMFLEQDVTAFEERCVLLLIKGLHGENKESSLKAIDRSIGIHLKDPEVLTNVFLCIAEKLQPTDILAMEGCLHSLYEKKDYFNNLVLSFVMHPKGMYRIAGRRLWDNYHLENSDIDVSSFDENLQLIFIVSMLQDFGNPETRLPKVLLLLQSGSENFRKHVMAIIHPYVDDYMGHVSNAIDKLKLKCKEANAIKKYVDGRGNAIIERRKLNELSPLFVLEKEYREAIRLEREHRQSQMKEVQKQHKAQWEELMHTVVLARGGGWREKDGKTRHLPVTKFSMPARQMTQSLSPKEQDEWLNNVMKDWDDTSGNY